MTITDVDPAGKVGKSNDELTSKVSYMVLNLSWSINGGDEVVDGFHHLHCRWCHRGGDDVVVGSRQFSLFSSLGMVLATWWW